MRRHNLFATLAVSVAPMLALGLPVVMSGSAATAQEAAEKAEQTEQKETKADQPTSATKANADSSTDAETSSTEKSQPSSTTKASGNGQSKAGSSSQSTKAEGSASGSTKAAGSDASASGSGELQLNQPGSRSATERSNQADRSSNQADRSSRQNGAQRRTANRPEPSTESATDVNRTGASARSRTTAETDSDDAATSDNARSRTRSARSQDAGSQDAADDQTQQRRTQRDRTGRDRDDVDVRSDRSSRDRDDVDVRSERTSRDRDDVDVRSESRRDRRFSQDRESRTSVRADRRDRFDSRTRFRSFSDFGLSVSVASDRLVVNDVRRNSVLRRFGIRQGDVIVSVSGHPVTSEADFIEYVLVEDVDRVPVVVLRDGREETLYIVPEEIYVGDTVDVQADYQQSAAAYLGVSLDRNYRGARVLDVQPGSPAEEAGIGRGDVILAINGRDIRSPGEVTQIIQQMEPGERIEIDLQRQVTDVVDVELGAQRGTATRSSYDVDVDVEPGVRYRDRVDVNERGPAYRDDFDARLEYQDRTRTRSSQSFEQDRTFDDDRIQAEGRFEAGGAIQRDQDSGRQGGLRGLFRGGR